MTQKIIPNLWFNGNAAEAVDFYLATFLNSKEINTVMYPGSVEEGLAEFQLELAGKVLTVDFELEGLRFTAINAGPEFAINPSISMTVNFNPAQDPKAEENLNALWDRLSDGGEVLMELQEYPFSKRYGWIKDRFGLSWQLMLNDADGDIRPTLVPSLMFGSTAVNQAEQAIDFYTDIFKNSEKSTMARYEEQTGPANPGSLMFAEFLLENQWFIAMDAGGEQDFTFNEGFSFVVLCKDQEEIDYFWDKLSIVPESEQCGWCKDQFGVSWQIVPENIDELMKRPGAFATLMNMKKIVIDEF